MTPPAAARVPVGLVRTAMCDRCGTPVIPCYPDQTLHPMCDPNPPTWTAEQLAHWGARVDARKAAAPTPEQPDGPGAMRRPGPSGHQPLPNEEVPVRRAPHAHGAGQAGR